MLIKGEDVELIVSKATQKDPFGADIKTETSEIAHNVLVQPQTGAELEASRPDGERVDVVFHFPKGYSANLLQGAQIIYKSKRYRVLGVPVAYSEKNTPGQWSLPVKAVSVDG